MPSQLTAFIDAVITIFAIVNPIGSLPVFASLTEGLTLAQRRRVLRLAGVVAFCIVAVMAVFGQFIIDRVFHIDIQEFAFGGGLLLVVIGIRTMVAGVRGGGPRDRPAPPQHLETVSLAVTPIASPLLVGPGAIVTVMLMVTRSTADGGFWYGIFFALAASLVAFIFVMLVLNWSHQVFRLMGRIGSLAFGRVMQIFIISIGIHFMHTSLVKMFPALLR
ncbi:MAG: MarC family protein [Phycisphaerae bacterium]|nr:MarC family protein [Phycisphaerae bacterium]